MARNSQRASGSKEGYPNGVGGFGHHMGGDETQSSETEIGKKQEDQGQGIGIE